MKRLARLVCLIAGAASLAACSSARDETWIGKNVGQTVDSNANAAH
jgi:hypothetical protein